MGWGLSGSQVVYDYVWRTYMRTLLLWATLPVLILLALSVLYPLLCVIQRFTLTYSAYTYTKQT